MRVQMRVHRGEHGFSEKRKGESRHFLRNILTNHEWTRIDTNAEEICPRITPCPQQLRAAMRAWQMDAKEKLTSDL
jgi:hypothetical protein